MIRTGMEQDVLVNFFLRFERGTRDCKFHTAEVQRVSPEKGERPQRSYDPRRASLRVTGPDYAYVPGRANRLGAVCLHVPLMWT